MLLSVINWSFIQVIFLILIFIIGFVSTFFLIPTIIKLLKKKNYIGIDIHKSSRPKVPESGGLIIVLGFSIVSLAIMIFFPSFLNETLTLCLTVLLAGCIGFIDDRKKLRSRYKIILTLFTGGLIFIANLSGFISITSPTIPFLGKLRLTVIYPLITPILVAVFANTVNMLEGYNGEGSGTCIIVLISAVICGLIWNSAEALLFSIAALAVMIPFFIFNKFPAKVFPGDVGTLSMGAILAGIALFGSIEAAIFCALLIHILNSFYVLYSVRGLFESSKIQEEKNDVILLNDDTIKASDDRAAALTLPRLILANGPLTEAALVSNIYVISIICGFFSIFTTLMMRWTIGAIDLVPIIIGFIIFSILSIILLKKFKRVRGVIILMIIFVIGGYMLLLFLEIVIMPIQFIDINLWDIIIIPTNIIIALIIVIPCLLLWYYITIKYFWRKINQMKVLETI